MLTYEQALEKLLAAAQPVEEIRSVPLLAAAVEDEYRETRDSMADVDPEQWSRINGMDPIRRIRTAE